jgi:hypothetical protein
VITKRVPGFKPSVNAFHFPNRFEDAPVLTIPIPPFGDIPIGNASNGLCGGMVFAVQDIFAKGLLPPQDTTAPKPNTSLFQYLTSRLLDSFNGLEGILKYIKWMRFPDAPHSSSDVKSIAWHTVNDEWPAIQDDLSTGQACPLGLIKVESFNPFDLGKNHQVLAYGYDLNEDSGDLNILVYDPNAPNADDVTLSVNLADRNNPSRISFSSDPAGRGFFRTRYSPTDPVFTRSNIPSLTSQ